MTGIKQNEKEQWPKPPEKPIRIVTYFNVDGYRYWVMSAKIEEVELINRAELISGRRG